MRSPARSGRGSEQGWERNRCGGSSVCHSSRLPFGRYLRIARKSHTAKRQIRRVRDDAATFFVMEMGDKTQLAAMALAASYGSLVAVVAGSTVGILLADVPMVILGTVAADKLPIRGLRAIVPATFLLLGVLVLLRGT